MRILVISLAGIGDTLIATPLIHELRVQFPDATLDSLVLWSGARDLLAANPHVNRVHQQDFFREGTLPTIRFLLGLRKERYDLSINTHPQSRIHYRVAAWLVGAPVRLSHEYDNFTAVDRLLVNRTLPQDYGVHSIENNLRLLGLLDRKPALPGHDFELHLTTAELASADAFLEEHRLGGRRLLGVHVGSGRTKNLLLKRWPLDSFIAVVRRLLESQPGWTILLFGGPEERAENGTILRAVPHPRLILAARPTLREAIALLGKCETFLSVDNLFMHLAAAMKVPKQVVIESPTFGATLAPYRRPYVLVENPAVHGRNLEFYRYDGRGIRGSTDKLKRCMAAVEVEAVLKTLSEVMGV